MLIQNNQQEHTMSTEHDDVVISVKHVSKKFCRNLKRSMIYGMHDLSRSFLGMRRDSSQLRKDEFWALDDISFELKRGECLGLIGRNGCGKSTLLRLLTGIFPPDTGEIMLKGRVGGLIALGAGFHPHMTGRENIYLNGAILGLSQQEIKEKFDQIVDFAEIGEFLDAPVSTYSSGMKVRLGFSIASQVKPDILLIDEVLSVGDIGFKIKCLNAITNLVKNAAVIFVSHSMQQIMYIATKVMVLDKGQICHYDQEVGAGIAVYSAMFKPAITQKTFDSQKITITQISINGKNSSETDIPTLKHGDDLVVRFSLQISKDIELVEVTTSVWSEQQARLIIDAIAPHDAKGFVFPSTEKEQTLQLTLPGLSLNGGKYSLFIHVKNAMTGELLLRYEHIAAFYVLPILCSYVDLVLKSQWEITSI